MDAVLTMIERGAEAIRERLIILCQDVQPNIDIHPLQDPTITFRLDLDDMHTKLVGAMSETAYQRYEAWYTQTPRPRGLKRNADTLGVSDIQPDLLALGPVSASTRSKKRSRVVGAVKRR